MKKMVNVKMMVGEGVVIGHVEATMVEAIANETLAVGDEVVVLLDEGVQTLKAKDIDDIEVIDEDVDMVDEDEVTSEETSSDETTQETTGTSCDCSDCSDCSGCDCTTSTTGDTDICPECGEYYIDCTCDDETTGETTEDEVVEEVDENEQILSNYTDEMREVMGLAWNNPMLKGMITGSLDAGNMGINTQAMGAMRSVASGAMRLVNAWKADRDTIIDGTSDEFLVWLYKNGAGIGTMMSVSQLKGMAKAMGIQL